MKKILLLSATAMLAAGIALTEITLSQGIVIIRDSGQEISKPNEQPLAAGLNLHMPGAMIPESAKMFLFGFGLVGIGLIGSRKRAK